MSPLPKGSLNDRPAPGSSSNRGPVLDSRVYQRPVLRAGPLRLDTQEQRITLLGDALALSAEEFALCSLLIEYEGIAVTAETMVAVAWGDQISEGRTLLAASIEHLRGIFAPSSAKILDRDGREFLLAVATC